VQQLGFKGFPEFKRQFLKEIGFATPYSLMSDYVGTLSKEKGKWIAEVFEKEIENMKRTLTNIDMKSFNRIIGLIESAPRTVVAAVSIAKALADRLTMALHAVKVPAYSVVASELYLFRETLIGSKDDLYIIIGLEKVPKEVIKIVDLLKQQGLKVVAITDDKNFKLAQSADYVIPVSSERIGCFYSVAPFNALFTAIGIGLAARTKGKTVESMEEMDKVWKRLV
jgi:DNA-binding MurR/RpiR family transcriptional regulator